MTITLKVNFWERTVSTFNFKIYLTVHPYGNKVRWDFIKNSDKIEIYFMALISDDFKAELNSR